ncbi:MAG: hypothetical protein WBO36_16250 [Saprospiraceae bacterium]
MLSKYLVLFILVTTWAFESTSQTGGATKIPFEAITETVFVDKADQGEYALSISIESGKINIDDYIRADDGKGHTYHFQVKEIKVNDQIVTSAKAGDHPFIVITIPEKAPYFDSGFTLSPSSYEAYSTAKRSSNNKEKLLQKNPNQAYVSFVINGKMAKELPMGQDTDPHAGFINAQNNKMTISLLGDDSSYPKRGLLTIQVDDFIHQKGVISNASFSFVRYKDAAGNMLAEWHTKKGTFGKLVITEWRAADHDGYSDTYLISGTFEAAMQRGLGYESETDIKEVTITKGFFKDIIIQELYHKK